MSLVTTVLSGDVFFVPVVFRGLSGTACSMKSQKRAS